MSFPETRHSLICRLASDAAASDWQDFLADYWGPICRFAQARASISSQDAEDITAQVFQTLWQSDLLARWNGNQAARLRTLICSVANNVLANDSRVRSGRKRLLRENAQALINTPGIPLISSDAESREESDTFYAAWVHDLLQQAVDALLTEYQAQNRTDCFRTLYGRLCEGMTLPEVADALGEELSTIERYNRNARERLREKLQTITRTHAERYTAPEHVESEFTTEWQRLGDYLQEHGGLENAVRLAYERIDRSARAGRQGVVLREIQEFPKSRTAMDRSVHQ